MGSVKPRGPGASKRAEHAAAEERGRAERDAGLHATSARYDAATRRVLLELTSGYLFGLPVARLAEIAHASETDLVGVELLGAGTILHWDSLDADYSVPALVIGAIGHENAAREFARRGGSARTDSKAAASRANGAKGGRPRTRAKR